MPAINPNLAPTAYGQLKPGDRVILWPVQPTRPDAHLHARTVGEIVRTYRTTGFAPNWALPRAERAGRPSNGFKYYDYRVVVWRAISPSSRLEWL